MTQIIISPFYYKIQKKLKNNNFYKKKLSNKACYQNKKIKFYIIMILKLNNNKINKIKIIKNNLLILIM